MFDEVLPVAKRELQVAARRRSTSRFQWWAALLAIAITFIWIEWFPSWAAASKVVRSLFSLQTGCAFVLALLSGPFLASDCLSEERRDGTLSLLFLTGIKARGVVLGKFIGTSFSAGYGLLALLPVMAIPILLGGVGLPEFGRMVLGLLNTLFFSLAIGLSVSAWVTSYSRGIAATLAILGLVGAVIPGLVELSPKAGMPSLLPLLTWLSPFYPFWCARDTTYVLGPEKYWLSLVGSHCLGWLSLALGSLSLSRAWSNRDVLRDRLERAEQRPPTATWKPPRRVAAAASFDPVLRLMGNASVMRWAAWLVVIALGAWLCARRCWWHQPTDELVAARAGCFLLKVLIAFQACRFFLEARRNGALELLLCTPLRNAELLNAQWRSLFRIFLWPVAAYLVLAWFAYLFPTQHTAVGLFARPAGALPGLQSGGLAAMFLTITLGADVLAICWFGTWLALTARKPGLAPALTIFAVLVLPSMLSHFDLVADMLFISWGSTHLQEDFRRLTDPTLAPSEAAAATEEAPPLSVAIAPSGAVR